MHVIYVLAEESHRNDTRIYRKSKEILKRRRDCVNLLLEKRHRRLSHPEEDGENILVPLGVEALFYIKVKLARKASQRPVT